MHLYLPKDLNGGHTVHFEATRREGWEVRVNDKGSYWPVFTLVRARGTLEAQDFEPMEGFHALKLQRLLCIA